MMNARNSAVALAASAVFAIALLAGCAQQPTPGDASPGASGPAEGTVSASASTSAANGVVDVLDGDIMAELHLDYSAGTGYEWQCAVEPEGVVSIVSQETQDMSDDDKITGGPLRDVVTIASVGPGTAKVTCSLVRPWETGAEPAEVQTFVYEVDESSQLHFKADESDFENAPEMLAMS